MSAMPELSRRRALIAAGLLPLLAACGNDDTRSTEPVATRAVDTTGLDGTLHAIEQAYSARVGVVAQRPDGPGYAHRGNERWALCSTFKAYAAGSVLRKAAAGGPSLDTEMLITPDSVVPNSPVTSPAAGTELSLRQLCEAALTKSDNTAGNYLLRTIGGPAAVTDFARSVGDTETRLDRWEIELNNAERGDLRDTTTPAALATGYQRILLGDGLRKEDREQLVAWMTASTTSAARMRAALPKGWTAADKTGAGDYGTFNDAGVLWNRDRHPLVVVILTDSTTGNVHSPWNNQLIADTTAAIVRAFG